MGFLIALGVFAGAAIFAGVLTALALSAFEAIQGTPQNQLAAPIFIITFLIGWLFLFSLARRRGK